MPFVDPTLAHVPLIVFAVPEEARPFERRADKALGLGKGKLIQWSEGGAWTEHVWPKLRVLITGMGKANAAEALVGALMESPYKPRPFVVLTCGFAGGLDFELKLGDVVFETDDILPLAADLRAAGAKAARFHCSDRVATTPAEKSQLCATSGADAVEMESSVIRAICRERGIPSATVRVISDTADESLPLDFNALMTADYRMRYGRLAWQLVRQPGRIPELMRFQKRVNFAAQRLAETLVQVLADAH